MMPQRRLILMTTLCAKSAAKGRYRGWQTSISVCPFMS